MRQLLITMAALSVLTAGCSHNSTKTEASPAAPAKATAATDGADKSKSEVKTKEPLGDSRVQCSKKGDERILEVREKDKGCELGYTKAGKENVVATGSHGTTYCTKTMEKIQEKLKAAGYDCK